MTTKPTLLLDTKRCKNNISRMASKAKKHNLTFRPHFKTHQSLEIGRWFKEVGVEEITVSSLGMADYFSVEWKDITVAFPVNILEIETINSLAERITLNLCIENIEALTFLAKKLKAQINIFFKIDVGYHRTGINPANTALINNLLEISNNCSYLNFKGFLGHAGHTYKCRTHSEIKQVHHASLEILTNLKTQYIKQYPQLLISLGDTPGCSVAEDFAGIDEIRPGNFVFYDLTQTNIGSNTIDQIAVALSCPIVAIHYKRSEIVIYGGGVHFSKEQLKDSKDGVIFGRVVQKTEDSWGEVVPNMYINSLSQEHGTISVPVGLINSYNIGDVLTLLPIHSCMTANLMKSYQTLDGKTISRL